MKPERPSILIEKPSILILGTRGIPASHGGFETFAERLRGALSVPVELIDESFSTVEAEEILLRADLSRARRKEVIDRLAAAVILQRWLNRDQARAPGR